MLFAQCLTNIFPTQNETNKYFICGMQPDQHSWISTWIWIHWDCNKPTLNVGSIVWTWHNFCVLFSPLKNTLQNHTRHPECPICCHNHSSKCHCEYLSEILNDRIFVIFVASPANCKLGLRMTTLHEEPSLRQPLAEEPEDSYSDPEYGEYEAYEEKMSEKPQFKSRLSTSKTMGSLMEIGNSHSTSIHAAHVTALSHRAPLKHVVGTPSMTSSTSSGYGSQVWRYSNVDFLFFNSIFCLFPPHPKAVSCSNLTNDDTLSLRSMSVDETPGNSHERSPIDFWAKNWRIPKCL